jgi:colicin import membrane protein
MSIALAYHEPYRFSAGMLALTVHLAFFLLLYFGVRWQSQPPESFMVEMWDTLPNAEISPAQEPPLPAKMEPIPSTRVVAPSLPPVNADIEVRDKKSKKNAAKDKKKSAKEKAALMAKQEAERRELEAYSDRIRKDEQQRVQAEQERVRAEVSAATRVQVERYQDMIRNKIRRKMKMVADVPSSAEAIFKVTLLPDGTLMDDPELVKSSGIQAYDEAAARAILSAEPLPVPGDVELQKLFRELKLSIRP